MARRSIYATKIFDKDAKGRKETEENGKMLSSQEMKIRSHSHAIDE
jgi:hypothetical protein